MPSVLPCWGEEGEEIDLNTHTPRVAAAAAIHTTAWRAQRGAATPDELVTYSLHNELQSQLKKNYVKFRDTSVGKVVVHSCSAKG